ncbi:MAG: hypothetical protein GY733_06630 [bacterium]|nr:hypothetical protein [bacterium]
MSKKKRALSTGSRPARQSKADQTPRSPLVTAHMAGAGTLIPWYAVQNPRLLVAISLPGQDEAHVPPGVLLTADSDESEALWIETAFENLGRSLNFGMLRHGRPAGGRITLAPDLFLRQLDGLIRRAMHVLGEFSADTAAHDDRVTARVILDDLVKWVHRTMLLRSGHDARNPLVVPQSVADQTFELYEIGRRLRHSWTDSSREEVPKSEQAAALKEWGVGGRCRQRREAILRVLAAQEPENRLKATAIAAEMLVADYLKDKTSAGRNAAVQRDCAEMKAVVDSGRGRAGYALKMEMRAIVRQALGLK